MIHGYLIGWDDFVYAAITYRINFQSSATVGPMLKGIFADFPKWNHQIDDIFAVEDEVVVR